jgi:hypothetical protein
LFRVRVPPARPFTNSLPIKQTVAGVVSRSATAPFERVKVILQTQSLATSHAREYTSTLDAFRRIVADQGVRSLWRGNGANVLRAFPTSAMRFTFFPKLCRLIEPDVDASSTSPPSSSSSSSSTPATTPTTPKREYAVRTRLLAGGAAGALTLSLTYPLDMARIQLAADLSAQGRHSGVFNSLRNVVRYEGGVRALFKGWGISVLEIAPYSAIVFTMYETLKQRLTLGGGVTSKEELGLAQYTLRSIGVGCIAGVTASLICYPVDTLRRNVMLYGSKGFAGASESSSVAACARRLYAHNGGGIRNFYRGCLLNAAKSAPTAALTFVTNDLLLDAIASARDR